MAVFQLLKSQKLISHIQTRTHHQQWENLRFFSSISQFTSINFSVLYSIFLSWLNFQQIWSFAGFFFIQGIVSHSWALALLVSMKFQTEILKKNFLRFGTLSFHRRSWKKRNLG